MSGMSCGYNNWGNLYPGMDGRYDGVANATDGVKASCYPVGGFIGMGF